MHQALLAFFMILLTITAYYIMTKLYHYHTYSFLTPILTATILIIVILSVLHIPYESYMVGGKWINSLLGPGVVALAYPLYKQRKFLKDHFFLILGGVLIVATVGMVSVGVIGKALGMSDSYILSSIPKSLTIPVAIAVTDGLEGNISLTVISVLIGGIVGTIMAPKIFKITRVDSPVGRGIALGGASHALGTTKAGEYGELAFSMGSVTMTLNAIIGSLLGPLIVWLLHI